MRRALVLALALAGAGCFANTRLDSAKRAVETAPAELVWRAATAADLRGLYESVAVEGEAASALWKVYYHFAEDGSYTGAALVIGGAHPEFQTLSGKWTLADGELDLGEGERLRAFAAADRLRLESATGVAVLRRVELQ